MTPRQLALAQKELEILGRIGCANMLGICVKAIRNEDRDRLLCTYSRSLGIVVAAELKSILRG